MTDSDPQLIRHATIDDLDALAAMESECFPAAEAADRSSLRARIETYPECFWQMIFGVDTAPKYQHRGCASTLMRKVIEDTRAAGRKGLVLTCKDRLVGFYAQFGYEDEGISESTHGDVVWHQMRLTF